MAKMLNYRFRYKVTAPFRATFCFGFVTHHMHIKRGDQQWAAAIRSRISLVTSEALARRCASSLREAHSCAGSPWTQQNVFFTTECSCEQQAVLYQIQLVGVGLHFILLGFFFSFLHVNISANLSSGFLAAVSLKKKNVLWPTKHGNGSFNEGLEAVSPKSCLQVFFGHTAEHRKCHSHCLWGTQLGYRPDNTRSLS